MCIQTCRKLRPILQFYSDVRKLRRSYDNTDAVILSISNPTYGQTDGLVYDGSRLALCTMRASRAKNWQRRFIYPRFRQLKTRVMECSTIAKICTLKMIKNTMVKWIIDRPNKPQAHENIPCEQRINSTLFHAMHRYIRVLFMQCLTDVFAPLVQRRKQRVRAHAPV